MTLVFNLELTLCLQVGIVDLPGGRIGRRGLYRANPQAERRLERYDPARSKRGATPRATRARGCETSCPDGNNGGEGRGKPGDEPADHRRGNRRQGPEPGGFASSGFITGVTLIVKRLAAGLNGVALCARQPCGLPLTPATTAAPGSRNSGQAQACPATREARKTRDGGARALPRRQASN